MSIRACSSPAWMRRSWVSSVGLVIALSACLDGSPDANRRPAPQVYHVLPIRPTRFRARYIPHYPKLSQNVNRVINRLFITAARDPVAWREGQKTPRRGAGALPGRDERGGATRPRWAG